MPRRLPILAIALVVGCAGTIASGPASDHGGETTTTSASAPSFAPPIGAHFTFRRRVQLADPHESHDDAFGGTWTMTRPTEASLVVVPHEGADPVEVTQHFDARGLPTDAVIQVPGFSNDTRSTFVMAPIGTAVVALPLDRAADGAWSSLIRSPELAQLGLPTEMVARCTTSDPHDGTTGLACVASDTAPTASVRVEVDARVDANGVARRCTVHIVLDVTAEGHPFRGESTIDTQLDPAPTE